MLKDAFYANNTYTGLPRQGSRHLTLDSPAPAQEASVRGMTNYHNGHSGPQRTQGALISYFCAGGGSGRRCGLGSVRVSFFVNVTDSVSYLNYMFVIFSVCGAVW